MPKIFFTSDLHFSHQAMLNFCPKFRPYADIESMNEGLIQQWNQWVKPEDTVYNLGDFSFAHSLKEIVAVLRGLNGKHHFVFGNHDELLRENRDFLLNEKKADGNPLLSSAQDYLSIFAPNIKRQLELFHYPIQEWDGIHRGSYMLHGHIHNQISPLPYRILNVGFDLHGRFLTEQDLDFFLRDLPVPQFPPKNVFPWQINDQPEELKYLLKAVLQERNLK